MEIVGTYNLLQIRASQIGKKLKSGAIGVIPTDTIYGICTSALDQSSVEKIYKLRKRDLKKPMIILISSLDDLKKFKIKLNPKLKSTLSKIWPNPVSVILECNFDKFKYLHRGTNSLAFRIPKNNLLLKILKHSGPLVAPSANISGYKEPQIIDKAKKYFKNNINFYLNGGKINKKPSTLIRIIDDKVEVLRKGAFKI